MPEGATASVQILSQGLVRKLSIAMVLGALAYGALLLFADAGSLRSSTKQLTFSTLGIATALTCGSFLVRFLRWAYYLRKLRISVGVVESALVFPFQSVAPTRALNDRYDFSAAIGRGDEVKGPQVHRFDVFVYVS